MCRVGDVESVILLKTSTPVAKKPHQCKECCGTIPPGQTYHREEFINDGGFSTWKTCLKCLSPRAWLGVECHGWVYGEVIEEIAEHLAENDYPPSEAELLRKWVDEAHQRYQLRKAAS